MPFLWVLAQREREWGGRAGRAGGNFATLPYPKDHAHSAASSNVQVAVVAEMRDVDPVSARQLKHRDVCGVLEGA